MEWKQRGREDALRLMTIGSTYTTCYNIASLHFLLLSTPSIILGFFSFSGAYGTCIWCIQKQSFQAIQIWGDPVDHHTEFWEQIRFADTSRLTHMKEWNGHGVISGFGGKEFLVNLPHSRSLRRHVYWILTQQQIFYLFLLVQYLSASLVSFLHGFSQRNGVLLEGTDIFTRYIYHPSKVAIWRSPAFKDR
jgi:hypothetical protein